MKKERRIGGTGRLVCVRKDILDLVEVNKLEIPVQLGLCEFYGEVEEHCDPRSGT